MFDTAKLLVRAVAQADCHSPQTKPGQPETPTHKALAGLPPVWGSEAIVHWDHP